MVYSLEQAFTMYGIQIFLFHCSFWFRNFFKLKKECEIKKKKKKVDWEAIILALLLNSFYSAIIVLIPLSQPAHSSSKKPPLKTRKVTQQNNSYLPYTVKVLHMPNFAFENISSWWYIFGGVHGI